MERWVAKIIAIIITFIIPFVFTMIPYGVHGFIASKGKAGQKVICYLMCFGGGIFFGTFLLHMGPEVRLILDTYLLGPQEILYPVTDLIIGAGFFFVLFLEKVVMKVNKKKTQKEKNKLKKNCLIYQAHVISNRSEQAAGVRVCNNCTNGKPCLGLITMSPMDLSKVTDDNSNKIGIYTVESSVIEVTEFRNSENGNTCKQNLSSDNHHSDHINHSSSNDNKEKSTQHVHHDNNDDDDDEAAHHNMRSLILVLALSLHHLFEGLTIGLQKSISLLVTLVIAIMCHEAIISFSVGLNFVKCKYSFRKHLLTALLVSLIMPIGEAIGTIMSEIGTQSTALEIASGVLQAFSAGTFLFVTFFEIFQEEISPHDTSLGKVTSAFIGFIVMALLMLMIPAPPSEDLETGHNHTTSAWM